jgi:signal-transduction protein with cAMP-binding, CBS, and nucleotidyltransferase domain
MDVQPDDPIRTLSHRPAVQVHKDDSLRSVAEMLTEESIGAAVVKGTRPPCIVSERDVVAALAEGLDPGQSTAADIMTSDIAWAAPGDTVLDVGVRMLENEIRHLPLVDDGVVVGVVSARDVLAVLVGTAGRDSATAER